MKRRPKYIVGVDEAGRGPLAGPAAVAAISMRDEPKIFRPMFKGIRDSKKFSEKQREEWFKKFKDLKKKGRIDFAVSFSAAVTIDKKGVTRAIRAATARAVRKLGLHPLRCRVLLDGTLFAPGEFKKQKTIIRGDDRVPIIAAASIVAKVCRDRKMKRLAKKYPKYGLEIHKGYGTRAHYRAIKKYGLSEIHRRSFLKNLP